MGSSIFYQAAEFLRENKTAKRALGIMVCLALLVALGTVGVLTSTGQALTKKVDVLDCVFAAHEHTPDCYGDDGSVICGYADYAVHVHNQEDCYDEAGDLVCPLPEVYPHTHTDECWQDVTELVCGETEDLGHTHSEACYSYEQGELTCVKEEHTHDETCYVPATVLTCEVPEHTHSEACYDPETGELVCGLEEHTHDGALCYTESLELACGKEEHTHDASCYEQIATLTCTEPEREPGHVHTGECYKTEHVLVCDKLEMHEHTEDCFDHDEAGNRLGLICGQTELLEHVHGPECFKTVEVLVSDGSGAVCGLVEHTHDESCFDPETGEPVCGYPEHTHDASCFPAEEIPAGTEPVYVCGLEEHTHSEACYDPETGEVICGLEEHTHGESCLAPAGAESEAAPETFCGKEEHTHSEACYGETGEVICGLEEHTHSDECFVEPAVTYCGKEEHSHEAVCYDEAGELICGLEEHTHDESCFIEPVVYYCGLEEHTHSETCYDESGALICGLEEHTHTDACLEQIIIQTADIDDHSLRVTAAYGPEANIPEGAVLKVEVIPPQGETQEQYSEYVEEARELFTSDPDHMQNMEPLALLNIGFFLADGTEVQPAAPVTMTIQFLGETGEFGDEIKVVHFADTGTEVLDSSEISAEQTTTFTAEGFSIYLPVSLTDFPEAYSISNGGGSGDHSTTQLEHHKTIDYLGDNNKKADKNPDTSLDNGSVDELKDKYRLYLDIVGKSEPANLLVVVDRSNSMTHKFGDYSSRGEAVYDLLFDGKDSMVYKFLERNEHATNGEKTSYVAVTWFGGWYPGYDKEDHYLGSKKLNAYGQYVYDDAYTSSIGYTKSRRYAGGKKPDAGLSLKWTSNKNAASKMGYDKIRPLSQNTKLDEPMEGTNYCAGLMYASYMLHNMPGNAADETIVIFISDGVPTYFYLPGSFDANTETKKVVRYGEAIEEKALSCADGLLGGTYKGQYGFFSNTKGFFDEFIKANSNVKFFTLGIALKSGGDRMSVLNYMSKLGNGKEETDNVTDYSSLKKALQEIIFPADVTITDTLSANVTLLTAQPDVKVTATPRDSAGKPNGDPIVLWKSTGSVTFSGDKITIGERKDRDVGTEKKIVSGVYYDGKKIWVDFRDDYTLDPNYTYTLSFNVELTEQAFDTYATNGYPTNGYPDTGENPSDYGSNKTSSGQSGLFSNVDKDTTVKYKIDYKDGSMDYEMPVVQAWKSEFTLVKQDSTLGADGSTVHNKLANVPFCLQRSYEGGVQYIGPTGAALYSGTVPTLPSEIKGATFYLTDGNGMLAYGGLAHGTYKLYELVPDAYEGGGTVKLVASFTVSRGRITYTDAHDTNLTWKADPHTDKVNTSYTDKLTLTVTNPVAHHEIQLIKVDGSTKANLAGAEFELRKQIKTASGESWNIVTTYKSVDNGVFFKGELYSGFYRLTEERAPDNYQLLEETVYFVVDGVKPYLHLADSTGVKINATANQYAEITQDGGLALKVYDKIKTFNFALRKVDMSGTGLAGAEFALYKAEDVTKGSDGTMTVIEGSTPIWQDVSGGDGKFAKPLPNDVKAGDTYYLFETVTPAGYNSLSGPIEIKVQNNGVTAMLGEKQLKFEKDVTQTPVLYTILIENSTGFVLPRSGGEGTTVYLLSGAALIALAGSLLLLKRKKEHEA